MALVAAIAAYAFTRLNYSALPQLPRLAGITAAVLGVGEAVAGWGLRRRMRTRDSTFDSADRLPPISPFVADRVLRVAKASALAGAALTGLWCGFGLFVYPGAARTSAAAADSATAAIGAVSAVVLIAGALWLEYCCRVPRDSTGDGPR